MIRRGSAVLPPSEDSKPVLNVIARAEGTWIKDLNGLRSLFCPGGVDVIEMALKLAKFMTGRFKTIEGNRSP